MPENGQPDSRLTELRQRWEQDRSSRLFLQLAEEHRRLGQLEEALAVLTEGLEGRPRDLSAQVALGRCRLELGQVDQAVEILEDVIARDPAHIVASKLLVEAYLQAGDPARAGQRLDLYRMLNDRDPDLTGLTERLHQLRTAPPPLAAVSLPATDDPAAFEDLPPFDELAPPPEASPAVDLWAAAPAPVAPLAPEPADAPAALPQMGIDYPASFDADAPPLEASEPAPVEPMATPVAADEPPFEDDSFFLGADFAATPPVEEEPPGVATFEEAALEPEPPAGEVFRIDGRSLPPPAFLPLWEQLEARRRRGAPELPPPTGSLEPEPLASATEVEAVAVAAVVAVETVADEVVAIEAVAVETVADEVVAIEAVAAEVVADEVVAVEAVAVEVLPAEVLAAEVVAAEVVAPPAAVEPEAAPTPPEAPRGDGAPPATATLGNLYLAQGHVEEAEGIFRQVLARDPENEAAREGLRRVGVHRRRSLTAADLLADPALVAGVPEGLTAKKISVLSAYLRRIQGSGRESAGVL